MGLVNDAAETVDFLGVIVGRACRLIDDADHLRCIGVGISKRHLCAVGKRLRARPKHVVHSGVGWIAVLINGLTHNAGVEVVRRVRDMTDHRRALVRHLCRGSRCLCHVGTKIRARIRE